MNLTTFNSAIANTFLIFQQLHPDKMLPDDLEDTIIGIPGGMSFTTDFMGPAGLLSRFRIMLREDADKTLIVHYYYYPEAIYDPDKPVPQLTFGTLTFPHDD